VPVGESSKFAAAIASHELFVIDGADHGFSSMAAQLQLLSRATAFLTEGLVPYGGAAVG